MLLNMKYLFEKLYLKIETHSPKGAGFTDIFLDKKSKKINHNTTDNKI